jgi:hypothetical protein
MARLVGSPDTAVAALRGLVRPVAAPDPPTVAGLIRDLDSPQFGVRERAARGLVSLGDGVEGLLRRALDGSPTPEARARIEKVLAEIKPSDHRVRQGRALEVLERIGDGDARRLLTEIAAGADGAWLTREAQASLGRLSRRPR